MGSGRNPAYPGPLGSRTCAVAIFMIPEYIIGMEILGRVFPNSCVPWGTDCHRSSGEGSSEAPKRPLVTRENQKHIPSWWAWQIRAAGQSLMVPVHHHFIHWSGPCGNWMDPGEWSWMTTGSVPRVPSHS